MELKELGNIPFDLSVLSSVFPELSAVQNKAMELEKSGRIVRLKKGVYVVSPTESGQLLSEALIANHIYGPSYISMETALRHYGLIPERVRAIRSMTVKHTRVFDNSVGRFEYKQCASEYFNIGIRMKQEGAATFLIASPEKALCDMLLTQPTGDLRFKHELRTFLEENLRFDMDRFYEMDKDILCQCLEAGKKKQLIANLIKLI